MANFIDCSGDSNFKSERVALIVDDEPDEAPTKVLLRFLIKAKIFSGIYIATSGEDAIATYREHPEIPFVTMDFNMPGMNGDQVIRAIRGITPDQEELYIIGITGADDADKDKMSQAGANQVFSKPINFRELRTLLDDKFGEMDVTMLGMSH